MAVVRWVHVQLLRWQDGDSMKIENIREVKTRLSRFVKELPKSGSVRITKNGRVCAALVAVTEDTDLEALVLSQNKRFWKLIDDSIARGEKEGFVDLADL
jgi:antitoxin (DNA-binding transcriptional repressor) of toxin-antitoxin stability system